PRAPVPRRSAHGSHPAPGPGPLSVGSWATPAWSFRFLMFAGPARWPRTSRMNVAPSLTSRHARASRGGDHGAAPGHGAVGDGRRVDDRPRDERDEDL